MFWHRHAAPYRSTVRLGSADFSSAPGVAVGIGLLQSFRHAYAFG